MKKITKIIISLFTAALFVSCGNTTYKAAVSPVVNSKMRTANVALESAVYDMAEDSVAYETERKLIKTGHITIELETLSESENITSAFAKSFGGYVTNSSSWTNSFNATVKVPADHFDEAMTAAGELGKLKYRSVNNQDVTDEYYDLETRLNTKKTMQKKLESYLSQAKNLSDLLEIERQLNDVTSEVESMEGRMKRLSNQIDYATIEININLPSGYNNDGFEWPDLGEKFRDFGSNFVNFLANGLMFIFYIVVFGIPVIALAALLFWLLFGRIGLLRKLFSKLRKK